MSLQESQKRKVKICIVAILLLIVIASLIFVKSKNTTKIVTDKELLKAMTYAEVIDGEGSIENTENNVSFDVFFMRDLDGDGIEEKLRGTCKQIGKEDTLYMQLDVFDGELKDAQIFVNENEIVVDEFGTEIATKPGNIYLQGAILQDDDVKENIVGSNIETIFLNSISGKSKTLTGKVHSGDYAFETRKLDALKGDMNAYSKINSITLKGTYVNLSGEEIEINKKVTFTVDWYGEIAAEIPEFAYGTKDNKNQIKDLETAIDEENNEFKVKFDLYVQETKNELYLQDVNVKIKTPELNGSFATKAEAVGTNTTSEYYEDTKELNVYRGEMEGKLADGMFGNNRINKFTINLVYPLEAIDVNNINSVQINVPVEVVYGGYNNSSDSTGDEIYFENPTFSETATGNISIRYTEKAVTDTKVTVSIGKKELEENIVSKEKIQNLYNNIPNKDEGDFYPVTWHASTISEADGYVIKETKDDLHIADQFLKSDESTISMENISKNVGIYFGNIQNSLEENGEIRVYDDETNNLVARFTKDNWNEYTSSNPYLYDVAINYVRVETSNIKADSNIIIYNIKEIDDDYMVNNYSKEEFNDLKYIQSTVSGYIGDAYINTDTNKAVYKDAELIDNYEGDINLRIIKTNKIDENKIPNIKFKLTGPNYEEGRILKTNSEGQLEFRGLVYNSEYVLEELGSDNFKKPDNIKFTITSTNKIYLQEGVVKSSEIISEDNRIAVFYIEGEENSLCNLEINKIVRPENIGLKDAKYRLYLEKDCIGEYTTDENGKILIENLCQYDANQHTANMYTLKEISVPAGYTKIEDIKFRLETRPDGLKAIVTDGTIKEQLTDKDTVKIKILTKQTSLPSFKLVNKDNETGEVLAGSKFAIYSVKGEEEEKLEIALDSNYNIIGTKEIIDGKEYYTLTTNENGEISAELREGLYKAVEIKTVDDKYDLTNNTYYFGVGINEWKDVSSVYIGDDVDYIIRGLDGYLGYGTFDVNVDLGATEENSYTPIISFENKGSSDAIIVKYDLNGKILWAQSIGGDGYDEVANIEETNDGGVIIYLSSNSSELNIKDKIYQNEANMYNYGILIKYDNNGNIEWSEELGDNDTILYDHIVKTEDNGYIKFGQFSGSHSSSIKIGPYIIENTTGASDWLDSVIVKYSQNGDIEWITSIGGESTEVITDVEQLADGGLLVYGNTFSGNSIVELDNTDQNQLYIEPNKNNIGNASKGMVFKLNSEGKLEKSMFMESKLQDSTIEGVGYVNLLKAIATSDGGFLASGEFVGKINLGDYVANNENNNADGIVIKYSSDCEAEWIKVLKGNNMDSIVDMVETNPDEYVIIGNYNSEEASIDSYTFGNTLTEEVVENETMSYYLTNSIVAKINKDGEILSANLIEGNKVEEVSKVLKTNDNGYIVIGKSNSEQIKAGENNTFENIADILIKDEETNNEATPNIIYNENAFMIKFDSNNNVECGKFEATQELKITKDVNNEYLLNFFKGQDIAEARLSNSSNFEVLNKRKDLYISTKVENNEGGTISGADNVFYENVRYGSSSTKAINIVPDEGYEIAEITINGKIFNCEINEDGTATIVQIKNITQDQVISARFVLSSEKVTINVRDNTGKPIENAEFSIINYENDFEKTFITNSEGKAVVQAQSGIYEISSINIPYGYENTYSSEYVIEDEAENILNIELQKLDQVIVHHYLKNRLGNYTTEKVAEDDIYLGNSGETYKVTPKLDLIEYELEKNLNNKYNIPNTAVGIYSGTKEVNYYYEERPSTLIVHHYNLGTNKKTYLGDYSEAEDKIYKGYKGEQYNTSAILEFDAGNPNETLAKGYSLVDIAGNETGTYKGNETVLYYYYDIEKFNITTKVNKHIEVNSAGEEIEVTGGTISGEGENPYEIVTYGGETARDYIVTPDDGYEIVKITVNGEPMEFTTNQDGVAILGYIGNIQEDKEIEVFFDRFKGYVTVHYIDEETDKQIIPDEVVGGYIGYDYILEPSKNVPEYYENTRADGALVGKFKTEMQEATFYFRLKNYEYTLEYYYDEKIDDSKTEVNEVKYGTEITLEDLTGKIEQNLKSGFRFDTTINLPVVITNHIENNTIKILYTTQGVIDETKSIYRVEYYYDDIIDNSKTDRISATIGDVIDTYIDKCPDGYTLVSTVGLGLIVDKNPDNNVIKIYYEYTGGISEEDMVTYVLEYYYDNIQDLSRRQTMRAIVGNIITKEDLSGKIEANMLEGYKLSSMTNIPLTVSKNEEDNIIKIYYVKKQAGEGGEGGEDEDKRPDSSYVIQYYYDDVLKSSITETIICKVGDVITRELIGRNVATNKIKGYKLYSIVNIPLTVSKDEDENIIKIKYVKKDEGEPDDDDDNNPNKSEYVVKYYYDGVIDNKKTETIIGIVGEVISTYTDNCIEGYRLAETTGIPLTISKDKTQNIIEIYYVIDDNPIIPIDPDDPTKLPGYKIEYYYDNVLNANLTNRVIANENTVITEDTIRNKIDKNTAERYRFFITNLPITIKGEIDENVVKVFYISDSLENQTGYKIEYYYDSKLNSSLTEALLINKNAEITEDMIADKIEKNKAEGYKFFTSNLPIIVGENINTNIVKVFYVSDNPDTPINVTGYKIEYYYDNEINPSLTEVIVEEKGVLITEESLTEKIAAHKQEGYKLFTTNLPIVVSEDINKNIVKVFYVKLGEGEDPENPTKVTGYKIEYYYDNEINPSLTEAVVAEKDTEITEESLTEKIAAHKQEGYKLFTTNLPIVVSEDINKNIVKVFYVKLGEGEDPENPTKVTGYKIEYYYDNEINPSLTEAVVAEIGNTITEEMVQSKIVANNIDGYKFSTTNLPIILSGDIDSNIIKIYYVKNITEGYILEYYYDDIIDNTKTEIIEAQINDTVTLEDLNKKIDNNLIKGYEFDRAETLPKVIEENIQNNKIKIYYSKASFEYTIEYYYNNVLDSDKTQVCEAKYQDIITQEMISDKIENNIEDSYMLIGIDNLPLLISEIADNNKIKVYYLREITSGYKVEYYYNGIIDVSKTEVIEASVGTEITTYNDKNIEGYELLVVENLPLVVTSNIEDNVIKVCYVKSILEGYKLEYYYDNKVDKTKTEMIEVSAGSVITRDTLKNKILKNTISGYEFDKVENLPLIVSADIKNNTIKIYYSKQRISYKVEYYYDGIIDDTKTQIETAEYQEKITEYPDKNITGYKLDIVENLPLIVSTVAENNIIKVYYVKNNFEYKIKYYYDNEIDESKTETKQGLYHNEITEYVDKSITGYKFDRVENLPLQISEIPENNIIKVYYIKDSTQTKTLSYTVEYYKDGKKVEADTQTETKTVQVLESDDIEVNKSKINTDNKYEGYRFEASEPEEIPNSVTNGSIIKVYYVKDKFEYKVEYYYDGVKDDTKTETFEAEYQEEITEYPDKNITGYKFDIVENLPLQIGLNSEENVIRVYYVKAEFEYKVEYYYNGSIDNSKTETFKALYQTQITREMLQLGIDKNAKEGYRLYDISSLPVISENPENNKIEVYYVKDVETGYILEYYYNGTKDSSKTEVIEANIGDIIETYPDKNIEGYKLLTVMNLPLTISENLENNIIKVCYIKDVFGYTVEYYYNSEIDDSKTERIEASVGDIITQENLNKKIEQNVITGYGYENTENLPLTVSEDIENNTIKVNYELLDYYYEIQYYYDGIIDHNKTIIALAKYGDIITDYPDKNRTGYALDTVYGSPLKVTENQTTNIIKVYYERQEFEYRVEYYFDELLDESLTVTAKELYGEEIREVPDKGKEGYKIERTENLPLIISENKENNIVRVYYSEHVSDIVVRYVDRTTGKDIEEPVKQTARVGTKFDISNLKKSFDGYLLTKEPEVTSGVFTDETQTFTYYYSIKSSVIVKYLELDSDTPLTYISEDGEEKTYEYVIEGYAGALYKAEEKQIPEYTLAKTTENTTGTMEGHTITVIFYYAKNTYIKVEHIDETNDKILKEDTIQGKAGDIVETSPQEFEGYKLSAEPENRNVTMKKDEVVIVKYYYVEISGGVLEKHIDNISGEILYSEHHEGEAGKQYKIDSREFEGYDVLEDKLPENSEGTMGKDIITVTYYYVRKAKVVVQYIDKLTNINLEELEIEGHENDAYNTESKAFDDYELVSEPDNKSGKMTADTIYVKYYYSQKSAGVTEKHIDVKTNEILEEKHHEGYVGDNYKIEPKEFEGYDVVQDQLPKNAEGTMTLEKIEVNYYYIKKSKVVVEYIDKTKDTVIEKQEIEGHEGESYKTEAKEFENYVLIEKPDNTEGTMLRDEVITVKYYYKNVAGKVIEQHIDVKTGKLLEPEKIHNGSEGDSYKISSKQFEGYDLVKEHLPENAEGTMTAEEIIVKYYYIRKTVVKVKYLDIDTKEKLEEDTIINGHEEQKYKTEAKEFKGYKLVQDKLPENGEGYMTAETIIVTYYYKLEEVEDDKPNKPDDSDKPTNNGSSSNDNNQNNDSGNNSSQNDNMNKTSYNGNNSNISNNNSANTNNNKSDNAVEQNKQYNVPYTGDTTPAIAIFIIVLIIIANITQLVSKKRNKKFIK